MYLIDKGNDERLDRPYYGTAFRDRLETGELWEYLVVQNLRNLKIDAYRPQQHFPVQNKMYGLHQRDIHIKLDKVRRLVVECKSRRNPFSFPNVLVGDCQSFDRKQFTVGAIVVVDTVTGDCRVAPGDKSEWLRVQSKFLSYSIPLHLFSPLDAFADAVKDGLYN